MNGTKAGSPWDHRQDGAELRKLKGTGNHHRVPEDTPEGQEAHQGPR